MHGPVKAAEVDAALVVSANRRRKRSRSRNRLGKRALRERITIEPLVLAERERLTSLLLRVGLEHRVHLVRADLVTEVLDADGDKSVLPAPLTLLLLNRLVLADRLELRAEEEGNALQQVRVGEDAIDLDGVEIRHIVPLSVIL